MLQRYRKIKIYLLAFSIIFFLVVTLGSTLAWMTSEDTRENFLHTKDINFNAIIDEIFTQTTSIEIDRTTEKVVTVKNIENTPAFIRVLAMPTMITANGTVLPCHFGEQVTVNLNAAYWKDGEDGYYYYLDILLPGENTQPLFESVKVTVGSSSSYIGADFSIHIKSEASEISTNAYRTSWWNNNIPSSGPLKEIDDTLQLLVNN